MAIGSMAKKALGLADEFLEGASKGIGDAGRIKNSVNRISSNMTKNQKKALKAFGQSKGNASEAVAKSYQRINQTSTIKNAQVRPNAGFKKGMKNFGKSDRVAGIKNATAANKAGDFFAGGARDTMAAMKNGQGFTQALKTAHTDASGKLRYDRVAGSFMTASAAARVATGGGLYKDRNGGTNIIGVPFI